MIKLLSTKLIVILSFCYYSKGGMTEKSFFLKIDFLIYKRNDSGIKDIPRDFKSQKLRFKIPGLLPGFF